VGTAELQPITMVHQAAAAPGQASAGGAAPGEASAGGAAPLMSMFPASRCRSEKNSSDLPVPGQASASGQVRLRLHCRCWSPQTLLLACRSRRRNTAIQQQSMRGADGRGERIKRFDSKMGAKRRWLESLLATLLACPPGWRHGNAGFEDTNE
jgi:hypothetical protein